MLLLALGGHNEHVGRDGEAFETWDQETGAPPQEVPLPGGRAGVIEHVDALPAGTLGAAAPTARRTPFGTDEFDVAREGLAHAAA